jgi:hypothetical protein
MKYITLIFLSSCSSFFGPDYSKAISWCKDFGGFGYKAYSGNPVHFFCQDGSQWELCYADTPLCKKIKYYYKGNLKEEENE